MEARYQSAARLVERWRRKKKLRSVGLIQPAPTGRPEIVYCGWFPKQDQLYHEVMITEFRLLFLDAEFRRNVQVKQTCADGVLIRDGRTCNVEIDMGTMPKKQMKSKFLRYREATDFLLVVCPTEKRLQQVMLWSEHVRDIALFTTFDRLKTVPEPWSDHCGNTARI